MKQLIEIIEEQIGLRAEAIQGFVEKREEHLNNALELQNVINVNSKKLMDLRGQLASLKQRYSENGCVRQGNNPGAVNGGDRAPFKPDYQQ